MFLVSFKHYLSFEKQTIRYIESNDGIINSLNINKYYDLFLDNYQFKSNPVPSFNPWQYSTFKTNKVQNDVYSIWGKIDKGFFISHQFKECLLELNLAEHVIFDGIRYFNGVEYKNDLSWVTFYKDYSEFYDIPNSTFYTVKKDDWLYKNNKYTPNIIENNLIFSSIEDMLEKKEELSLTGIELNMEKIELRLDHCIDFLPLYNIFSNSSFFCSENFVKTFKKNKLTGLTFIKNNIINVNQSINKVNC